MCSQAVSTLIRATPVQNLHCARIQVEWVARTATRAGLKVHQLTQAPELQVRASELRVQHQS